MSDQTERIDGGTHSWAEVLEGPLMEKATLVLRDDSLDPTRVQRKSQVKIEHTGWGRYELQEKIGEGGMGVVYLALDKELGRKVAVKILQVPDHREEDLQRFIIEARVTSQLEHPNIVPVYEVGTTPDGELFYTMKRIRGRELGEVLKDEGLTIVRRIQILIDVCDALEYAHARGVVHRDIKPDNILIGSYGEVLLADWGLARVLDQPETHTLAEKAASSPRVLADTGSDAVRLTQFGEVIGTIAYMSPEQARGDHHLVGPETDIYALGAVLYQALTGVPPFVFDKRISAREMLIEVAESEARRPRSIDSDIPPDLEAIVIKSMASKMRDRYQRIRDMREDLMAFLEHRPVSAHQAGAMFRLGKLFDRHRTVFRTGLAAVMLLLVCATAFAVQMYQEKEKLRDEKARTQALLEQVQRQQEDATQLIAKMKASEQARVAAEAQRELITQAEKLLAEGRFQLENDERSAEGLAKIRAAVKRAPGYYRTHYMLGRTLAGRDEYPKALASIDRCLAIKSDFLPAMWTRSEILKAMADAERDEAKRVGLKGRLRDTYTGIVALGKGTGYDLCAEGYLLLMDDKEEAAREKFQAALNQNKNLLQAQVGLLSCFGVSKQIEELKRYARIFRTSNKKEGGRGADQFAKQLFERTVNRWQSYDLAKAQEKFRLGNTAYYRKDYRTALTHFGEAARLYRRQKLEGQECRSLTWVAYCHAMLGARDKAVALLGEILPRLDENKDEEAVTVRAELGKLLNFLGEHDKAIKALSRVVKDKIDRRELDNAAYYMGWIAQLHLHLGQLGKARNKLDAATELMERGETRRIYNLEPMRAQLLRYEGEPEQALALYSKLTRGKGKGYTSKSQRMMYQLGEARCHMDLGDLEAAEKIAKEVETTSGRMRLHSQVLSSALLRMDIARRQGDLAGALKIGIRTRQRLINPFLDLQIGSLAMILGKDELAETHLARAQEGYNPSEYALLYRILVAKRQGTLEALRKKLGNSLDGNKLWPAPLASYMLGRVSLGELQKAAQHPLYQMEMAYFLGEIALAEGASIRALDHFRLATQSGLLDRFSHQCSLDRLKTLSK